MRENLNFDNDRIIIDIYDCATEVYGKGIAVPTIRDGHPCGWDWLDFGEIFSEDLDILTYKFCDYDISKGFGCGEYEDKTLKEILKITNGRFAFEININNIDWYND